MALDDIGWYVMVLESKQWFEYWDIQIWKSGFSNLNIPIFKFEYPIVSVVNLGVGIFKFENRDIQIWKSGFSNLKIGIFKFEYKNDAV